MIKRYAECLLQSALFRQIKEEELEKLLSCLAFKMVTYEAEEYLFHAGDEVGHIGIVLEGCIEIIKENIAGERHIIAFLEASHMFGESIVCTSKRIAPVSTKAREKTTVILIPYKHVIENCSNGCSFHTQLIHNMLRVLGDKNEMLNIKMELLLLKGMREKLATYLLKEAQRSGKLAFNITPNREALAEFLNVSRPSMCRELARMKEDNLIDFYKNSFKLLDIEALKKCLNH